MLQRNSLLRGTGLAAFFLLTACAEGSRDISPWSRLLPSEAGQSLTAMALDSQGEPAVTGTLIEGMDLSITLPDGNGQGVFLSMLDDTGEGIWGGTTAAPITQGRSVSV